MKKLGLFLIALIILFVSCETYEEQNVRLVTGGLPGLIIADVATDTLGKLQITNDIIKNEKYVLYIRAIGNTENPIVLGNYGARLECEGPKKTWLVGSFVETEQPVRVKKNSKGEYKISQFNSANTTHFIKTKYK